MKLSIRKITVVGVLTALIIVLGISGLGIMRLPGLSIGITILHIPVIIGAIMEGPLVGGLIGLLFGVWSMIDKVLRPTPTGFVFLNPLVSVLSRILIGLVAYYSYKLAKKCLPDSISMILSSILATLTNTVGVLGMIYLLFAQKYMETMGQAPELAFAFLSGVAVKNGIPESIACAVLAPIIIAGIKKIRKN
ncbi:MAG: ECF transporter S component [Clostridiaceae bacterium]|nr:ECF transporter S component [Clostridiaceae bacterium]